MDIRESTESRGTSLGRHREGPLARTIEQQTSRLPTDTFLWLAVGAMGVSAVLQFTGRRQVSNFVGQWAPALLIMGVYNKIVKVAGSDRSSSEGSLLH